MKFTLEKKLKILLLRGIRGYTYNSPFKKGKYRLYEFTKRFCQPLPQNLKTKVGDGRKFSISFNDWSEDFIFFLGEYDPLCTEVISQFVKKDDVCLDVGANFGWYTTLFLSLCGPHGEVHSFEPVPDIFQTLKENVALNGSAPNIFLNNFGLGDKEEILNIHIFEGQPSGHSSLMGRPDEKSLELPVKIKLLNDYLKHKNISRIDFIKVDIEGAEMMFLKGGDEIFNLENPPALLMEMVSNTSKIFGYTPNDLLELIREKSRYEFYKINETDKILEKFETFAKDEAGANILCVPSQKKDFKLRGIVIK